MSEKRCGTCKFYSLKVKKGIGGIVLPGCLMTNKVKAENDGSGCWGWKPRSEPIHTPQYLR